MAVPSAVVDAEFETFKRGRADLRGRLADALRVATAGDVGSDVQKQLLTTGVGIVNAVAPEKCEGLLGQWWTEVREAIPDLPNGDVAGTLELEAPGPGKKKYFTTPSRGLVQAMGVATWPSVVEARHATAPTWSALFRPPHHDQTYDLDAVAEDIDLSYDAFGLFSKEAQLRFSKRCMEPAAPRSSFWGHQDQNREMYTGAAEWIQGVLYLRGSGAYGLRTQVWGPPPGETVQEFMDRFRAAFPLCGLHYQHQAKLASMVAEGASRVQRLVFVVNALATSRQDGSHTDLTIAEKQWLEANGRCHQPEVKQGQLFLWMSGLPHANVVLPGPTGTPADYEDSYRVLVNGAPHSAFHPAELATRAKALCHEGQSSGHAVARLKASWHRRPNKPSMKRFTFGLAKDKRAPIGIRKVAARDPKRNAALLRVGTVADVRAKQAAKVVKWKAEMDKRKAAIAQIDPRTDESCWETQLFPAVNPDFLRTMRYGEAIKTRERAPYLRGFKEYLADPAAFVEAAAASTDARVRRNARLVAREAQFVAGVSPPEAVRALE